MSEHPYGRTYCLCCDGWADDHKGGCSLAPHSTPVEMRHCDGCGEDYNAFTESHVGHVVTPPGATS